MKNFESAFSFHIYIYIDILLYMRALIFSLDIVNRNSTDNQVVITSALINIYFNDNRI